MIRANIIDYTSLSSIIHHRGRYFAWKMHHADGYRRVNRFTAAKNAAGEVSHANAATP